MNTKGSTWDAQGPKARHVVAAVAACVLSLLIHMGLFSALSKVRWDLLFKATAAPRERHVVLQEVRPEIKPMPRVRDEDVVDSAAKVNVSKAVKALGLPLEKALVEPPALPQTRLAGDLRNLAEPTQTPALPAWEPRQEILAVSRDVAKDDASGAARRFIPEIERVASAPDVVFPVDRSKAKEPMVSMPGSHRGVPEGSMDGTGFLLGPAWRPPVAAQPPPVALEPKLEKATQMFTEKPAEVTPLKPIEKLLKADLVVYQSPKDPHYGYFKIEIARVAPDILPVIPKDVLLVLDCSASMAEQRLYFCRKGMALCLDELGPHDRFNVVSFREKTASCFTDWAANEMPNLNQGREYIAGLRAGGNTDIFASIRDLLSLPRTAGRPVVALLVSDGVATTGLTGSSDIIGEFSKVNDGEISIFTVGTIQAANRYLMDLLSYCNRGGVYIETRGRWDIPDTLVREMRQVSRPVLSDVGFRFAGDKRCEVYPVQTSNLYLDRPLVLYGRFPTEQRSVAFQAVGKAADMPCDMVFNLGLGGAPKSDDKEMRLNWARQKVYYLMGQYARRADPEVMKEIRGTARAYEIDVPYKGRF